LSDTLKLVHLGIAGVTKTPELELDDDDAKTLSKAVSNVLEEFDIRPDPKAQAVVGMIVACGMVYGPKLALIKMRVDDERKEKKAAKDNVVPFLNLPENG